MWRSFLTAFLDLLFPVACFGCQTPGSYLCVDCVAILPPPKTIVDQETFAALPYEHPWVKKLIWRLKYGGARHAALVGARIINDRLGEDLADLLSRYPESFPLLLCPIPLSPKRFRERGFNQAAEIAKHLAAEQPKVTAYRELLRKIKETVPQAKLASRGERLKNLRGVFAVAQPELVAGRVVLVVDDVTTTGATIREARRALKAAGARKVIGLALAHG